MPRDKQDKYQHQSTSVHEWRFSNPKVIIDHDSASSAHHINKKPHVDLKAATVRNPDIFRHPRDVWHLPPKQCACAFRNWPLLLELLHDVSNTEPNNQLLHDAVLHGADPTVLQAIIDKLDKDSHWAESLDGAMQTPLHSAILCHQWSGETDQEEVVRLLLRTFPDACLHPNINGQLPLHLAASNKCYTIDGHVGETHGKQTGRMPAIIHMLCETNPSTCEMLDFGGHTALALACNFGHPRSVSVLVNACSSVAKLPDRRGDLPIATLAFVAGQTLPSEFMKTALCELRKAYPLGLIYNDRRHRAPVDYVMQYNQHDAAKLLTPRMKLDPMRTKNRFKKLLYSKFCADKDRKENFVKLVDDYNFVPPVIDRMFYSRPWVRPRKCAPVPVRCEVKEPHRPSTPIQYGSFAWYAKDPCHLKGWDFNERCRHFDKVMQHPSPRLRRLVESDRLGKRGKFQRVKISHSPIRPRTKKRIPGGVRKTYPESLVTFATSTTA